MKGSKVQPRIVVDRSSAGGNIVIHYHDHGDQDRGESIRPDTKEGELDSPVTDGTAGKRATAHVLVIFVHGLYGASGATWKPLIEKLREATSFQDFAVFDFGYPAKLWNVASIHTAARDLLFQLRSLDQFEHYIFVCHSAGGLVVQRALILDLENFDPRISSANSHSGGEDRRFLNSIFRRTLFTLNLAVPFSGASLGMSLVSNLSYWVFFAVAGPFLVGARLLSLGKLRCGLNRIIWQLRYRANWLSADTATIATLTKAQDLAGYPCPETKTLVGRDDLVITKSSGDAHETNHFDIKADKAEVQPTNDNMAIFFRPVSSIIGDLIAFANSCPAFVARHTALFSADLDRQSNTQTLLSTNEEVMSQDSMLINLLNRYSMPERMKLVVCKGSAGVGKTTVLRHFARHLAARYLRDRRGFLPVVVQLRLLNFSREEILVLKAEDAESGRKACELLFHKWAEWAREVAKHNLNTVLKARNPPDTDLLTGEAILKHVTIGNTVLILDGLDEFAVKNSLTREDVLRFVSNLKRQYGDNDKFTIVVGVRDSFERAEDLASYASDVLRLPIPAEDQASRICPAVREILPFLEDQTVRNLVLTPLVLVHLGPLISAYVKKPEEARRQSLRKTFQNRTDVLLVALECITNTRIAIASHKAEVSTSRWLDALSAIGFTFYDAEYARQFGTFLGGQTIHNLSERLRELEGRWGNNLTNNRAGTASFAQGIEPFLETSQLRDVLEHTIFTYASFETFKTHDTWQVFLTAYYIARCVECGMAAEFGRVFFRPEMVYIAGTLLDKRLLAQVEGQDGLERVSAILKTSIASFGVVPNPVVSANAIAVICGNESGTIHPSIAAIVLSELQMLHPIAAMVGLNSIGHVALRQGENAAALREILMIHFVNLARDSHTDIFLRSLASHYCERLDFDILSQSDLMSNGAASIAAASCTDWKGHRLGETQWRSLIRALIGLVGTLWLRNEPKTRTVACIHYLYLVTVLLTEDVGPEKVKLENLQEFIRLDGNFYRTINELEPHGNLRELYEWIRRRLQINPAQN